MIRETAIAEAESYLDKGRLQANFALPRMAGSVKPTKNHALAANVRSTPNSVEKHPFASAESWRS